MFLLMGFQSGKDPISKCEVLFDERKISKIFVLIDEYVNFNCVDSVEMRSATGSKHGKIAIQGDSCRIETRKKLDFSSYQVVSCDSNAIRFRRNYIQYFTLSQNEISAIAYDTISSPVRLSNRQSSSMIPVFIVLGVGIAGAGYLAIEIIDGLSSYHMPDP